MALQQDQRAPGGDDQRQRHPSIKAALRAIDGDLHSPQVGQRLTLSAKVGSGKIAGFAVGVET